MASNKTKKEPSQQEGQKPGNKVTWSSIDEIEKESPPEFRFRAKNDPETIKRYAEAFQFDSKGNAIEDDENWPFQSTITVYQTEYGKWIVLSGMHRLHAAIKAGRSKVKVTIFKGTEEQAIWYGLGANRENGLRLSNGDLKHCIKKARILGDKSNRVIASHLGCSASYVDRVVNQLPTGVQLDEKRTGKDGKQYPAQKTVHKKQAPVEQEQADVEVVSENMGQQDNKAMRPVNTVSQTWQDPFREFLTYIKNDEGKLTPQTGLEILKHIYEELESADRTSFIDKSLHYIWSTSEYKAESKRRQNEKNSKTANQGAEHEQAVTD